MVYLLPWEQAGEMFCPNVGAWDAEDDSNVLGLSVSSFPTWTNQEQLLCIGPP